MLENILELSIYLISIRSTTENTEKNMQVLRTVQQVLSDFSIVRYQKNGHVSALISNKDSQTKNFTVILNAHLDVIPGGEEQFHPYKKNGRLYGRGAFDMKAAAAVMILLFKEIANKVSYPLALQLVTDEELGGVNGTEYQIQQGVRGKFILCGEGTNFKVIHKAKGGLALKLTTNGHSVHSGYPWLGENAVWKMHKALEKIIAAYPTPQTESDETLVNITSITTNNVIYNKIPDDCTAYIDVRYAPKDEEIIMKKIRSLLPDYIDIEVLVKFAARDTNPNNPYIKRLQEEGGRILQTDIVLDSAHGGSDVSFYTEVGCTGIEFGPIGGNNHAKDEWVDMQSLSDYYQILKQFLLSLS